MLTPARATHTYWPATAAVGRYFFSFHSFARHAAPYKLTIMLQRFT